MKTPRSSLILLLAALGAGSAYAQQGGVTILRGDSANQPRPGVPDTGVRRIPSTNSGSSAAGPSSGLPPAAPRTAEIPIASQPGQGLAPADASSDLAQAMSSSKQPLSPAEAAALSAAFKAIDDGRYSDAHAAVANFNNPLLTQIVGWHVLRVAPKTDADFASTWRFLREHPDWPEPELLRRQAEDRITPDTPPRDVWRYFVAFPPLTSQGHLHRLEAASAVSPKDVPRLAGESWRTATFRRADEDDFLNRYSQYLSGEDQVARFDRILKEGRAQAARDLLSKLPPDYQPLAEARLAMATRAADAVTILRGVPAAKLNDPTIRLERISWLRRTGKLEDAKTLLSGSGADQGESWWNERQQLARDLLAAGKAADAYAVAAQHGQSKGVAFAEAEFLAGWIALRHLKKPAEGLKHFQTLYDGVSTDISRSRAAYWLGRGYEASGHSKEAKEWYGRAAAFGQTFYGQLAARKLPGGASRLPSDPVASDADQQSLSSRELVNIARYIGQAGDSERTRPFLLRLARLVKGPGETLLLSQLAVELRRPDVALVIARRATENGVTLFNASFPVVDLGATGSIERALALAVTRQESAFNAAAVSPSGALGLMQLMPGTARDVAGRLGLPFIQDKLTRDPGYNVALGSQYLAEMLQRFGGSYELALAAYNAGPNRVARWLETIGDPRGGKIDMVDWIEMIPLRETRNYVQRIMEGVGVYRDRLSGPFTMMSPAMGRS
ncbi:soluble lytic murein transglycosylase [Enhydrobacter aerosaccus]|uniref:Soluble lytic murein transglycosylase n=1 Tax=Enhydrobacter aerosaccus TaxID=225324 RepID=A0A1T4K305_9HYPH|nr:lytic transglycosylase domain-containing protein [Enhydrobacter aerosaccus]SJZ36788.1 soluble lytic murein transglycosylase [Enhydrobacter aerosaccus]